MWPDFRFRWLLQDLRKPLYTYTIGFMATKFMSLFGNSKHLSVYSYLQIINRCKNRCVHTVSTQELPDYRELLKRFIPRSYQVLIINTTHVNTITRTHKCTDVCSFRILHCVKRGEKISQWFWLMNGQTSVVQQCSSLGPVLNCVFLSLPNIG